MSSIDPIRPVSGPPPLRPLRRREREQEGRDERREPPADEREPEDEATQPRVDFRA